MTKILSPSQTQWFEEKGTLFPVPVLTAEEVDYFLGAFTAFEAAFDHKVPKWATGETHLHFPWAYELATHPKVLDVAEDLLGPDFLVHSTTLFHKRAGEGTFASWHQDGYFMDLSEPDFITIWVALTHSTAGNGCVRVLPGTHKLAHIPHGKTAVSAQNLLGSGLEISNEIDTRNALDVVLAPGELSVHHVNTVHGSEPNYSDQDRIGFVVKLVPTRVSQTFPHFQTILARGKDDYGHWTYQDEKPGGNLERCIQRHLAFCEKLKQTRTSLGRKSG